MLQYQTFLRNFLHSVCLHALIRLYFFIIGDSNIHVNDPDSHYSPRCKALLSVWTLNQHINFPTHHFGNNLDLLIIPKDQSHVIPHLAKKDL